jgi:hypothetical protein
MGCGCGGGSFRGSVPRRSVPAPVTSQARPAPVPQQSQNVQGQRTALAPDYIVQSQVLAARRANAARRQV